MGDSKTKAKKPSRIKGLKAEFKKIIWPDKRLLQNKRWQLSLLL